MPFYIISGYDSVVLDGPFDEEEDADFMINTQEDLAGGITYESDSELTVGDNVDKIFADLEEQAVQEVTPLAHKSP